MSGSSWITFTEVPAPKGYLTKVWHVETKADHNYLGAISWYSRWRQYVFHPGQGAIFEEDCLREIAGFCEGETTRHKASKK